MIFRVLGILIAGGLLTMAFIYLPRLYFAWLQRRSDKRLEKARSEIKQLEGVTTDTVADLKAALTADEEGMTILTHTQRQAIERVIRNHERENK
jgi:hypothetical protein